MITASVGNIGKNFPNAAPEDVAALEKNILDMVNESLDPAKMSRTSRRFTAKRSRRRTRPDLAFYDTPSAVMLTEAARDAGENADRDDAERRPDRPKIKRWRAISDRSKEQDERRCGSARSGSEA